MIDLIVTKFQLTLPTSQYLTFLVVSYWQRHPVMMQRKLLLSAPVTLGCYLYQHKTKVCNPLYDFFFFSSSLDDLKVPSQTFYIPFYLYPLYSKYIKVLNQDNYIVQFIILHHLIHHFILITKNQSKFHFHHDNIFFKDSMFIYC